MAVDVRVLACDEAHVLSNVDPDVFDHPVDPAACAEFFADNRHHICVALDSGCVVGMASGLHYCHPDKPNEFWINELGVAASHRRRGIGRELIDVLLAHARELGCREAWVATEAENLAARGLYAAVGGKEQPVIHIEFELDAGTD